MNAYGQRWAPWGWGFVISLVLWTLIVWLAFQAMGCAAMGAKHTIEFTKGAKPGTDPCPPDTSSHALPACPPGYNLVCTPTP